MSFGLLTNKNDNQSKGFHSYCHYLIITSKTAYKQNSNLSLIKISLINNLGARMGSAKEQWKKNISVAILAGKFFQLLLLLFLHLSLLFLFLL